MADHAIVPRNGNTNNPTVMAESLSPIFSVVIATLEASDNDTGFNHHMSRKIF
jgi:hypothetical protein